LAKIRRKERKKRNKKIEIFAVKKPGGKILYERKTK